MLYQSRPEPRLLNELLLRGQIWLDLRINCREVKAAFVEILCRLVDVFADDPLTFQAVAFLASVCVGAVLRFGSMMGGLDPLFGGAIAALGAALRPGSEGAEHLCGCWTVAGFTPADSVASDSASEGG